MDETVSLFFMIISKVENPRLGINLPPSGGAVSRSMRRLML
jgi:hypothetical protein